jgi:hypothetical protein
MDAVVYGMAFGRPLSNLPAAWFLDNMLLPLARKISPSLLVGSLEEPYFFTPLITASQVRMCACVRVCSCVCVAVCVCVSVCV